MKIRQLLSTLTLMVALLFSATFSQAQCPNNGEPTVEIGDACVAPGGMMNIPIRVYNWTNMVYWQLTFCASGGTGFTSNVATSYISGQNVIPGPSGGDWTFFWGSPVDCPARTLTLADGAIIGYIKVSAKSFASGCLNISLCNTVATTPSHYLRCEGSVSVEATPTSCSGQICLAPTNFFETGFVRNMNGQGVSGVQIKNSVNNTVSFTSNSGFYFMLFPLQGVNSVTITPQPKTDLSGLSNADILAIRDHILGLSILNCYQRLAADVNGDGKISGSDLVTLRKTLLYGTQHGNAGNWVFIPASHNLVCPSATNLPPSGFPTSITVTDFCSNANPDLNFIGVKIGDVDGTATTKMADTQAEPAMEAVKVGPNPFVDRVTFDLNFEDASNAEIRIYDLTGKLLHQETPQLENGARTLELDGSNWPTGTLMYQVITPTNRYSGRMVHVK